MGPGSVHIYNSHQQRCYPTSARASTVDTSCEISGECLWASMRLAACNMAPSPGSIMRDCRPLCPGKTTTAATVPLFATKRDIVFADLAFGGRADVLKSNSSARKSSQSSGDFERNKDKSPRPSSSRTVIYRPSRHINSSPRRSCTPVITTVNAREELGKARELLKAYKKANGAVKTRLGGPSEKMTKT
ncbi:hypothetical protein B0H14DRAFT_2582878 [Mycena olivaceomarginata]|nr:hypothetical protein B0H14DRAFT_2582878 [Mycena olivaceomarginata]